MTPDPVLAAVDGAIADWEEDAMRWAADLPERGTDPALFDEWEDDYDDDTTAVPGLTVAAVLRIADASPPFREALVKLVEQVAEVGARVALPPPPAPRWRGPEFTHMVIDEGACWPAVNPRLFRRHEFREWSSASPPPEHAEDAYGDRKDEG